MKKLILQSLVLSLLLVLPAIADEKLSEVDIVRIVIQQNQDLSAASRQINISEAELIRATSLNNLSAIVEGQQLSPSNIIKNENAQFNIGVGYEFLLGNQLDLRRDIALYNIDIAKLEFQNRIKNKVFNAKQTYDEFLYRYRLIEIRKDFVHNSQEIYEATNKQFKAGEIAKYDVFRAELEKNSAQQSLETRKREAQATQNQLNFLLNSKIEKIIPKERLVPLESPSLKLDNLLNKAIDSNPELQILNLQLKSEEIRLQLAKIGIFPTLNTEMTIGNQGLNAKAEFPIPFFNRQQGEIAVSQATSTLFEKQYQAKKQEVLFNINTAYQQLRLSVNAVKAYETSILNQSRSLRELAVKRLIAGEGSILEVLDVDRTLNQNEDEYAKLVLETRKNYHYLEYIIGGSLIDK